MSEKATSILVSGWRFIAHSYAVINQFQCLELLRRGPALQLFFEDMPYFNPAWKPMTGLFGVAAESALRSIPALAAGLEVDAELRYGFPFDLLRPPRAARTMVFGSAEILTVRSRDVAEGISVREAQHRRGYTIVTCSNWSRQGFMRAGVPPDSVVVVPLGFDPGVFRPATDEQRRRIRAEVGLAPDDFVFLHIGAMTQNKGLRFLLPAFAELVQARPQVRLVLKGMDTLYASNVFLDQEMQALEPRVAQAVASRLSYVGDGLPFEEMARVYQAADCYVSPYIAEGFNMPALEAAASGLPVICTAGGPTDDFVTDDFALRIASKLRPVVTEDAPDAMGLLPDREHLIHLMLRAVDDAQFRISARSAGPAYVGERFTWEKVVDGLLSVVLADRN